MVVPPKSFRPIASSRDAPPWCTSAKSVDQATVPPHSYSIRLGVARSLIEIQHIAIAKRAIIPAHTTEGASPALPARLNRVAGAFTPLHGTVALANQALHHSEHRQSTSRASIKCSSSTPYGTMPAVTSPSRLPNGTLPLLNSRSPLLIPDIGSTTKAAISSQMCDQTFYGPLITTGTRYNLPDPSSPNYGHCQNSKRLCFKLNNQ